MPDYQILPATWRDVREGRALQKVCFGAEGWGYFELISSMLWPGTVRFKALAAGQMVGLVIGDDHRFERVGWIATIGVHPDHQKRGIGEALLTACESALTEPRVKLTVRASNDPALMLYTKLGYKRVGVWRRYYYGGEDGIVMEKVLAQRKPTLL